MLYQVTLYEPNPYERCSDATRTFTVGSLRAAELAAKSILKPFTRFETSYSARVNRTAHVNVRRVGKAGSINSLVDTYEPITHIVPSIGERGY